MFSKQTVILPEVYGKVRQTNTCRSGYVCCQVAAIHITVTIKVPGDTDSRGERPDRSGGAAVSIVCGNVPLVFRKRLQSRPIHGGIGAGSFSE